MKNYIGIAVLVAVVLVGAWYFLTRQSSAPETVPQQEPAAAGVTRGYSSSALGFSIIIPVGYTVDESYKYQLNPEKIISGVKFTIPRELADGTNLSHDTYLSVESMPQMSECTSNPFLDGVHLAQTLTDNGVTYAVSSAEGAGAGNRYVEIVYALPGTSPCLAVRYFVHYGVIQNYPEGTVAEFDLDRLLAEFDLIRATLVVEQ